MCQSSLSTISENLFENSAMEHFELITMNLKISSNIVDKITGLGLCNDVRLLFSDQTLFTAHLNIVKILSFKKDIKKEDMVCNIHLETNHVVQIQ